MVNIKSGITGGIVATFVMGAMMLMSNAIHRVPNLRAGDILAAAMDLPSHPVVGWIAYLVIGAFVLGSAFAVVAPRIPTRSYAVKGLIFGMACWLIMMIVVMPLAGVGFFGLEHGHVASAVSLVLNIVYGIVLALVYRWGIGSEVASDRVSA